MISYILLFIGPQIHTCRDAFFTVVSSLLNDKKLTHRHAQTHSYLGNLSNVNFLSEVRLKNTEQYLLQLLTFLRSSPILSSLPFPLSFLSRKYRKVNQHTGSDAIIVPNSSFCHLVALSFGQVANPGGLKSPVKTYP